MRRGPLGRLDRRVVTMTIPLSYAVWGWREHAAALRGAVRRDAGAVESMIAAFRALGYGDRLLPTNLGRTALRLALIAAQRREPQRREVLTPVYVCPSVVETIREVGLTPTPVPIDACLNLDADATERRLAAKPLAVLAAHLYACPAPIERLVAACAAAGTVLIDDAAHVIGVAQAGRPLGCHGDVGVISFNHSKTLTGGSPNGGGLICVREGAFGDDIARLWSELPVAQPRFGDYASFLLNVLGDRFAYPPADYLEGLRRRLGMRRSRPRLTSARMPAVAARTILAQRARLQDILAGKRRVAANYAVTLPQGVTFPQFASGRYLSRVLVKLPDGLPADRVQQALRAQGIRTRRAYPAWSDPADPTTRQAVELRQSLIELPGGIGLTEAQIKTVCDRLRAVLAGA
jgi:dTDP-4-amino-4,6-dideoxygalactose transaminase